MRPDRFIPIPPSPRRATKADRPLRRFLRQRALRRFLAALGLDFGPERTSATALARLDDRLLRDVGLRRERGPFGDRYRPL